MNHRFHDTEWVLNYAETVNVRRPERLEVFIEVAREKLAPFNVRVTLYRADLNESDWPVLAGFTHSRRHFEYGDPRPRIRDRR